jgi:hypothetical protein
MSKYPRIADDGLAMNLETAALVATDSTIDQRCARECKATSTQTREYPTTGRAAAASGAQTRR